MSMGTDADIAAYLVGSFQTTRYAVCAAATLMIYDHLISLHREVELIWRKRNSFMKNVYLWHRYFGTFCILFEVFVVMDRNVSDSLYVGCYSLICPKPRLVQGSFWFRWELFAFAVSILTSELVLLSWVFVIYDRSVSVVATVGLLYLTEVVAVFTILGISMHQLRVTSDLIPHKFCSLLEVPPLFKYYWVPFLVYNGFILLLFVFKSYEVLFSGSNAPSDTLLKTVYHNSAMNYITIFTSYVVCCIVWLSADFSLGRVPVMFVLSFSMMNACRLLLNIREVYFVNAAHKTNEVNIVIDGREIGTKYNDVVSLNATSRESQWMYELRALRWTGKG